jgi:hypothetical protein
MESEKVPMTFEPSVSEDNESEVKELCDHER